MINLSRATYDIRSGTLTGKDSDRDRRWWTEKVMPNSLHYIPGDVAHRLINTSDEILTVLACWNSDAGHDYASIEEEGFSVRYFKIDGKPTPVEQG